MFIFDVSPSLGLAQISYERHRSERVVSYGNAHEPQVVCGHGFVVHRPLGESSTFDTGNRIEADYHQVAVRALLPRWRQRALL